MQVKHPKTNNITAWTQTDLNNQIALGNFPAGTTLNDITLSTDWNTAHTVTGTASTLAGYSNTGASQDVTVSTGLTYSGTTLSANTATSSALGIVQPDNSSITISNGVISAVTGGSGTVSTTGTPASGNLTKFSGSLTITNGDLSGDVTTSGTLATTLATVNSNTGSFGSSTSIPNFTVNGKGLITAAGGNAVIAPAGTLTGTTLASGVVTSSLTTVGTIGTGTWQGTKIGAAFGGTNSDSSASTGVAQVSSGTWSFSTALVNGTTATTQTSTDNSTKVATTAYVTTGIANAIAAVNPAVAVQAATAAVLPNSPTYNNGASGIGATLTAGVTNTTLVVDGYTPLLNDRILVKNQASALQNGVYTVTQLATVGLAWILTRAIDYDQPSDINNTGAIPVVNGTANSQTQWVLTSTVNTVGTDSLTFTQFSVNPSTIITNSTSAGGDLSGTYPNPTVAKINTAALGSTTATSGNILIGSGTQWVTNAVSGDGTLSSGGALTVTTSNGVAIVTTTGTQTLTNKRITKRVTTAADATSITPNTDSADITYQSNSQAGGTLTINADGGTPTNGQAWLLKLKCTNAQTFSWNAGYVGGTVALPTTTTGSGKIDYYSFIFDTVNSKWQYTGTALGF